ncbi:hypothetical protein GSI_03166 [Ganoderma sinense ZZ0214-1]|uniref:AB hydrolase-1 domain-containing protein n=1 Tax=Ganoderma sinense ZZ0214-1 TaxID=1077348 RepID=A0A2G8SKU8_9APHY|nr:hypothetical protein GSI_03166 [Ganoderma sinense ZZ0214-1]
MSPSPSTTTGNPFGLVHDTGPPPGSQDYTTLVVLHGHNWHSSTFVKTIPLASNYNTRLILLNRRGYPGSTAFTDEELSGLPELSHDAGEDALEDAKNKLGVFLRGRAREVFDFLEDLVRQDDIPPANPERNAGGIVVVGWSFGALWMSALMAYVSTFPVNDVELAKYVRKVVILDTGNLVMNFPVWSHLYHRSFDMSLPKEERTAAYNMWDRARKISSYYSHGGETLDTLSHEALTDPPSTLSTLSEEERANLTDLPGGLVDAAIMMPGLQSGFFADLRRRAFLLPKVEDTGNEDVEGGDAWSEVEFRVVWCQMSTAEVAYIMLMLIAELEEAKKKGEAVRNVKIVRVKRGNHFVQWDQPDMAMRALVGEEDVI